MADEKNRTLGTETTTTRTGTLDADRHDANPDPLTGEPGAHPVGTGVGAATGGTVGAVIGGAVGGPVGAIIGAAVGGLTGGFAGKGLAESVNPTEEDTFWSGAYKDRPYAQGQSYEDLRPAYRYGWESRTRYADRDWHDVENNLQSEWSQQRQGTSSNLDWNTAKPAAYDAWNRVENRHRFNTEEEPYWQETYKTRPYAQNRSYEDLSPAYRYGWESGHTYGREGRWEDHENALERGWDKAKGNTKLAWNEAKDAVRDAWDRATNKASHALNRDTTGTYSPTAGTTLGTGLGSGTAGVSAGGTFPAGTGSGTTVPTATDMIGGATEGAHDVVDPERNKTTKL